MLEIRAGEKSRRQGPGAEDADLERPVDGQRSARRESRVRRIEGRGPAEGRDRIGLDVPRERRQDDRALDLPVVRHPLLEGECGGPVIAFRAVRVRRLEDRRRPVRPQPVNGQGAVVGRSQRSVPSGIGDGQGEPDQAFVVPGGRIESVGGIDVLDEVPRPLPDVPEADPETRGDLVFEPGGDLIGEGDLERRKGRIGRVLARHGQELVGVVRKEVHDLIAVEVEPEVVHG